MHAGFACQMLTMKADQMRAQVVQSLELLFPGIPSLGGAGLVVGTVAGLLSLIPTHDAKAYSTGDQCRRRPCTIAMWP